MSWALAMDVFSKEKRSEVMSLIRSKDTKPEVALRRVLHASGFRFRIHDRTLPGRPDIVLRKYKSLIQVKGCFWHGHTCKDGHIPKSNQKYWTTKILRNKQRDRRSAQQARRMGWLVINVWECQCASIKKIEFQSRRIANLLVRKSSKSSSKASRNLGRSLRIIK